VVRASLVKYIDETAWLLPGDRPWLWVMATPVAASLQRHPLPLQGHLCPAHGRLEGPLSE
jgi:hypothetical protein